MFQRPERSTPRPNASPWERWKWCSVESQKSGWSWRSHEGKWIKSMKGDSLLTMLTHVYAWDVARTKRGITGWPIMGQPSLSTCHIILALWRPMQEKRKKDLLTNRSFVSIGFCNNYTLLVGTYIFLNWPPIERHDNLPWTHSLHWAIFLGSTASKRCAGCPSRFCEK